jgi:hypothetical protein
MSAITKIMRSEGCSWREAKAKAKARANAALPPAQSWRDRLAGIASRMRMRATVQAGDHRPHDEARHYHSLTGFAAEIEALLAEPEAPPAVRAETVLDALWSFLCDCEAAGDRTRRTALRLENIHHGEGEYQLARDVKHRMVILGYKPSANASVRSATTPPGVRPQTGGKR